MTDLESTIHDYIQSALTPKLQDTTIIIEVPRISACAFTLSRKEPDGFVRDVGVRFFARTGEIEVGWALHDNGEVSTNVSVYIANPKSLSQLGKILEEAFLGPDTDGNGWGLDEE